MQQGFTPEQALNKIEADLTQNVTGEKITVRENSKFPTVVKQISTAIDNINEEKPADTNTEALLEEQLSVDATADQIKAAMDEKTYLGTYDSRGVEIPEEAAKRIPRIKAWFKKHKVPISAKEAFKVRNPKAKSLFNTAPGVVHVLSHDPVAKKQIYQKLNLTPEEQSGLDTYLKFHQRFQQTLNEIRTGFDRNDRNNIFVSEHGNLMSVRISVRPAGATGGRRRRSPSRTARQGAPELGIDGRQHHAELPWRRPTPRFDERLLRGDREAVLTRPQRVAVIARA